MPTQIARLRSSIYRTARSRRVRSMPAAAQFINQVGFCWLFAPAHGVPELPSLFEAVKGRRGVQISDWDADSERVWVWKNDLPAARRAYYGKALVGRPSFVSLKMLPYLLANSGEESVERIYSRGGISYDAKKVHDVLRSSGPRPTMALRAAAGLGGKDGNVRYHHALDELQRRLIVLPIGATNEVGSWPSQIFELVGRWFPDQVAQAKGLDLREARTALVLRYVRTVVAADIGAMSRLFAIPRQELHSLLADMVGCKQLHVQGDYLVSSPSSNGRSHS